MRTNITARNDKNSKITLNKKKNKVVRILTIKFLSKLISYQDKRTILKTEKKHTKTIDNEYPAHLYYNVHTN